MGKEKEMLIRAEEELNILHCIKNGNKTAEDRLHQYKENIAKELKERKKLCLEQLSFYQEVCYDIRQIKMPSFLKKNSGLNKNGENIQLDEDIDIAKFYLYAYIDKNTWFYMKNNKRGISKESALKLVIALQLTEQSANALLEKISFVLNTADYRDQIVIALLESHCYNPNLASEVLDWYSKNGKYKFKNIYEI